MTPQQLDDLKKSIYRKQKRLQRNRENWSNQRKLQEQTEINLLKKLLKLKLEKHEKASTKPQSN